MTCLPRMQPPICEISPGIDKAKLRSRSHDPRAALRSSRMGDSFLYRYKLAATATNDIIVSGSTSPLVTSVDIDCVLEGQAQGAAIEHLATGVQVLNGKFSTVGSLDDPFGQCRLRAVPTGVDPTTAYLGSTSSGG